MCISTLFLGRGFFSGGLRLAGHALQVIFELIEALVVCFGPDFNGLATVLQREVQLAGTLLSVAEAVVDVGRTWIEFDIALEDRDGFVKLISLQQSIA